MMRPSAPRAGARRTRSRGRLRSFDCIEPCRVARCGSRQSCQKCRRAALACEPYGRCRIVIMAAPAATAAAAARAGRRAHTSSSSSRRSDRRHPQPPRMGFCACRRATAAQSRPPSGARAARTPPTARNAGEKSIRCCRSCESTRWCECRVQSTEGSMYVRVAARYVGRGSKNRLQNMKKSVSRSRAALCSPILL